MLMISRRIGERILIGKDIEITITEIHRRTVRLAIKTGPQQILRGEVHDAIERANRLAAETVIDDETLASLSKGQGALPSNEPAAKGIEPEDHAR